MLDSKQPSRQNFQRFVNEFKLLLVGVDSPKFPELSNLGIPDSEKEMARRRSFVILTDLTKFEIVASRGVTGILKYPTFSSETRYSAIPGPWADVVLKWELGISSLIIENEGIRKAFQNGATFDISYLIKSNTGQVFKVYQSSLFVFTSSGMPCGRIDYCTIGRDTHDSVVKGEILDSSFNVLYKESDLLNNIFKDIVGILGFSKREIEICYYLLLGYSNSGVAKTLMSKNLTSDCHLIKDCQATNGEYVAIGTVRKHTSNITQKGKVLFPNSLINEAHDVALLLFRHGILSQEEDRLWFLIE